MRRALGIGLAIALATTIVGSSSGANLVQVCPRAVAPNVCPPKLDFDLHASIMPRKLSKDHLRPVALRLEGDVINDDQSHPPALREVVLDVDGDLTLNAAGIPACTGQVLRRSDTAAARDLCRDSIIGAGQAHIGVASISKPVPTTLTLFNGGLSDSKRLIYLHAFLVRPAPAVLVAPVRISRNGEGLRSVTRIPRSVNGSGSILDFTFTIRRLITPGRGETGYLEGKCSDGSFKIDAPRILFKNDAQSSGVAARTQFKGALIVPCTPLA